MLPQLLSEIPLFFIVWGSITSQQVPLITTCIIINNTVQHIIKFSDTINFKVLCPHQHYASRCSLSFHDHRVFEFKASADSFHMGFVHFGFHKKDAIQLFLFDHPFQINQRVRVSHSSVVPRHNSHGGEGGM